MKKNTTNKTRNCDFILLESFKTRTDSFSSVDTPHRKNFFIYRYFGGNIQSAHLLIKGEIPGDIVTSIAHSSPEIFDALKTCIQLSIS